MRHQRTARRLALTAAAVTAAVGVVVPMRVNAAESTRARCAVSISYEGAVVYANTYSVTPAAPVTDDRSTVLRQDVFSSSVAAGTVSVGYFKDVNVFDSINLNIDVPLTSGRGSARGSSDFTTSNQPNHTTGWTVTCGKN